MTRKQKLMNYLNGELEYTVLAGVPILSFREDRVEQVADEILKELEIEIRFKE